MDTHNQRVSLENIQLFTSEYLSYCQTLSRLDFSSSYMWISMAKVVSSFAAQPLIIYMVSTRRFLMYNEINPLIYFKAAILFIYAVNVFVATSFQIVELAIYTDPCDRIQYTSRCAIMKAVNYASTFSISAVMLVLVLDAGFSLWLSRQRTGMQQMLSRCLLGILVFSFTSLVCMFYVVESPGFHLHIHCFEDSALTRPYAQFFQIIQIVMDGLTVGLSVFLTIYCKRQLRLNRADLNRTFIVRQSYTLLKAFFPLTIYHTVTLVMYNIAYALVRLAQDNMDLITFKGWQAFTNIIPYYVFVAPLLLMFVLKKLKKNRNNEINHSIRPSFKGKVVPESKLYFEMLHQTWTTADVRVKR